MCLRILWTWNADRSRCPEGVSWWLDDSIPASNMRQRQSNTWQGFGAEASAEMFWNTTTFLCRFQWSITFQCKNPCIPHGCLVTCETRPHSRNCQRIQRWGWWGVMFQNCWHGLGEISPWELKGFNLYVFPVPSSPFWGGFGFAWKVGGLVVFVVDPWCQQVCRMAAGPYCKHVNRQAQGLGKKSHCTSSLLGIPPEFVFEQHLCDRPDVGPLIGQVAENLNDDPAYSSVGVRDQNLSPTKKYQNLQCTG